MTLTDEQKQALRTRAASAKPQSKLQPLPNSPVENFPQDVLDQDVSRETFRRSAGLEQANLDKYTDDDGIVHLEDDKDAGEHVPVGPIEHPTPIPEEESGGIEHTFQFNVPIGDPGLAEAMVKMGQDIAAETSVDDIPWNGGQPFQDVEVGTITSLVPLNEQNIVEGFTIPPGMDEDAVLDLSSAIYTYIGPIPVHIGRYTNKWFKVLGCCVQPLEGDVVNERTGEVEHIKWERPLFKLDKVDPDTGENIIAYGGGIRGLQIARHFNAISGQFGWTVGDFKRPRMFYVQQENRENAHVMYGFRHRACTDEEMSK